MFKKIFKKDEKSKKNKTFTKEKFNKMLKICLISYVIISLISAFTSNFILFSLTILTIVLLVLVVKRKPREEIPEHLLYCSKHSIDISNLPEEYKTKMISIYSVLYNDAKHNNKLINSEGEENNEEIVENKKE